MAELDKFADTHISQRFSTVNGVSQVQVFGSQKYAVRLFVDPNALAKRGLGLDKVVSAIQNANSNATEIRFAATARRAAIRSNPTAGSIAPPT